MFVVCEVDSLGVGWDVVGLWVFTFLVFGGGVACLFPAQAQ